MILSQEYSSQTVRKKYSDYKCYCLHQVKFSRLEAAADWENLPKTCSWWWSQRKRTWPQLGVNSRNLAESFKIPREVFCFVLVLVFVFVLFQDRLKIFKFITLICRYHLDITLIFLNVYSFHRFNFKVFFKHWFLISSKRVRQLRTSVTQLWSLNFLICKTEIILVFIWGECYKDTVYKGLNTVLGIKSPQKFYYFEQIKYTN